MQNNQTPKISFCTRPFHEIEIHSTGEVYTCCPNWNKFYSIGNIFKDSFENVWNSDKAIDVRKRILNNDYSLCDVENCPYIKQNDFVGDFNQNDCEPIMKKSPTIVKFVYDKECNIACKICRDKIKRLSDEDLELLNSKIDTFFLPLLESTESLIVNSYGDPFGSRHSSLLIKKAAEKYPNLKFDFHTNGILCNETHFKNINITPDKIGKIRISIHAATAKTYAKTVPNGEFYFPKIIENLRYLQKLKKEYNFPVYIHFVVTSDNYKEIPDFIKLAEEVDASPRFWEYRETNCDYQNPENLFVCNEDHPLHKELVKVLQHPLVKQYKQYFSPIMYDKINS